jgi:hypothetical protein
MSVLVVQLNHPGAQKPFHIGRGYRQTPQGILREWNNDPTHYRKFIQNKGIYLSDMEASPISDDLLFWGEWEGNSLFEPLSGASPNGIHQPVHDVSIRGHQNTDPYVFGSHFYYAICKQRSRLTRLSPGSVVLFGSSFKNGFALDTVFVVGGYQTVQEVALSGVSEYSAVYCQATLEQLGETYFTPSRESALRLYWGRTYQEQSICFSYVPCKPMDSNTRKGFPPILLPYEKEMGFAFSSNPTGIKMLAEGENQATDIWQQITLKVVQAGYGLGVSFQEPY